MKKICLTGATGFIGSRMALYFRKLGHSVIVLALVNNAYERKNKHLLEANGVEVVVGDINDSDKIAHCFKDVNWVFHLAAAQHEAGVPDEYFRRINVNGTSALLEAAVNAKVERFIYGSTIGVYGNAMNGELDEDSPLEPANIYGITKREAEKLVLSYKDRLAVTVIRISETYGPGDKRLLKLFKGIAKNSFFIIGNGQNIHQLIHVEDLIRGMESSALNDAAIGEVFVLAGSEKLTTVDMCLAVGPAVNQTGKVLKVPLLPFFLIALCLEVVCKPLRIQPPLHRRRLDFFTKSFYFKNDKAKQILGFEPKVSFVEGAKKTADWYRSEGLL